MTGVGAEPFNERRRATAKAGPGAPFPSGLLIPKIVTQVSGRRLAEVFV